ncbi:MBL fold metallo-hydrolase [uncultured Jatrophihabitans sp.]|uniref:MBL fold metallo-hydrolase n=1 Tax=uncultured Jatrophihabitans sp. TaxID=1610747 RepID=UPI0035C9F612
MTHPAYETVRPVLPNASVLLQANPGPMTLDGTNTWLLRGGPARGCVVVDPGEEDDAHLAAVLEAAGEVALVLLTHGHHDHSGAAAALHEATGASVRAADAAHCHGGAVLADGETLEAAGIRLRVLATPGHTADSVSFALDAADDVAAVLTGDTILGRGTTVVAHPDGVLGPYLDSLQRLHGLGDVSVLPGHGPELPSVAEVAGQYLTHRAERLEQVRGALRELGAQASARQIVELVYADVDQAVWWAAELSVAAQLDYLRAGA